MDWASRRRLIYGLTVFVVLILALVYLFRATLFPAPTCFDKKQNGFETGIDCGGTCALRCKNEITPISVRFVRAIRTGTSTYDLMALLSNNNIDSAPRVLHYAFRVRDAQGKEISKTTGSSIVPVGSDFPVIVSNVQLSRPPHDAQIVTDGGAVSYYKAIEDPSNPTFRVVQTRYELGSISRVYATIHNTKRTIFYNVPVRVLLYNTANNVFAVGEATIPSIDKEQTQDVIFTWHGRLVEAPTRIRVFPILNPFGAPGAQ